MQSFTSFPRFVVFTCGLDLTIDDLIVLTIDGDVPGFKLVPG